MTYSTEAALPAHNPVAEILEALMDKHNLNQTDLANQSGVSQPAINRILNERSRAKKPRRETLEKIGGVLGVTPEQLTGESPVSVRLFDKGAVPICRWETLSQSPETTSTERAGALVCPVPHSDLSFALPVIGEAMSGEDGYREGDVIFVDPGVKPTHGRDVVAVGPKVPYLRRLVETPEGRFLKTLNAHWPNPILPLTSDITIIGTVIFSGRIR
jgi:SOS-response transcriptional repressor LexA